MVRLQQRCYLSENDEKFLKTVFWKMRIQNTDQVYCRGSKNLYWKRRLQLERIQLTARRPTREFSHYDKNDYFITMDFKMRAKGALGALTLNFFFNF